jgi:Zn ribbon nucleic-acid-binding protein
MNSALPRHNAVLRKKLMKKAKCPRCDMEYDMLDEAASKAIGGLCAACWYQAYVENRNIENGEQKVHGQKRVS